MNPTPSPLAPWIDIIKHYGGPTGRVERIDLGIDGHIVVEGQFYAGTMELREGDTVTVVADRDETLLEDVLTSRDSEAENLYFEMGQDKANERWRKRLGDAKKEAEDLYREVSRLRNPALTRLESQIVSLAQKLEGLDQ